jgi:hypothetical protein
MKQWLGMVGVAVALSFGGSVYGQEPAAPAAPAPAQASAAPTTTTTPTYRARGFRGRFQNVGLRAKLRSKFGNR